MKKYSLRTILTLTTGRMLLRGGVLRPMVDMMEEMTDRSISTLEIIPYANVCKTAILVLHPTLGDVDASHVNGDNIEEFVSEQEKIFGSELNVPIIPKENLPEPGIAGELITFG